jgi:hypothetical protein
MFTRSKYKDVTSDTPWENVKDPIATLKADGANYFISIDSEGKPSYISRRPSVKGGYPDRTESLPHLQFQIPELAGQVLNAELIHSGFSKLEPEKHNVLSGILNSLPERAIKTQNFIGPVRVMLHNVINPDLPTYGAKLEHMKQVERLIGKPDLIFIPQVYTGHEAIRGLIKRTKDNNQEGVIVTSLTEPEPSNVRLKVKNKETFNLLVSKIIQEVDKNGSPKASMGALELSDRRGKVVGKVGSGFSRQDRIDAWNNPENWLGHGVQVTTMGFAINALRMPVYNGFADGDIDII